jgi:hypothetical protein
MDVGRLLLRLVVASFCLAAALGPGGLDEARAAALLSKQEAFAKAIAILQGDPYGRTPAEVSANIRQAEYSANGGTTPCGSLAKPLWTFHVVVSSSERKIDGYLVLDARYGELLCANLPMLD